MKTKDKRLYTEDDLKHILKTIYRTPILATSHFNSTASTYAYYGGSWKLKFPEDILDKLNEEE